MEVARRALLASALAVAIVAPASAQVAALVTDPGAYLRMATQLKQDIALVTAARANLERLRNVNLSNIPAEIQGVTGSIEQAQAACQGVVNANGNTQACAIRFRVATMQSGQLANEMNTLTSLQAAASGASGGLMAQQASAQAAIENAKQMLKLRQLMLADADQRTADNAGLNAIRKAAPTVNPY